MWCRELNFSQNMGMPHYFFLIKIPKKKYPMYLCSLKTNALADFPLLCFTGIKFTDVIQQVCNVTYPFPYLLSRQVTHLRHSMSFFCTFFVPLLHQHSSSWTHIKPYRRVRGWFLISKLLFICVPNNHFAHSGIRLLGMGTLSFGCSSFKEV